MPIVAIKKSDAKLQVVYGEVYIPNVPDTDKDFMTAEEIQKAAHKFMKDHGNGYVNVEHKGEHLETVSIVESFLAREGDPTFIPGAWVAAVHIPDAEVWEKVVKGELNAFSLEGAGRRSEREVELELESIVKGETTEVNSHSHSFEVSFSDGGTFLGGYTDTQEGHFHKIIKGTATEEVNEHSHAFHCIEAWTNG